MITFMDVREQAYEFLYERYISDRGPWAGRREFAEFCKNRIYMKGVMRFAKERGHIRFNIFGGVRLTAAGVIHAEQLGIGGR